MEGWIDWVINELQPLFLILMANLIYVFGVIILVVLAALLRGYGVKKLFKVPFRYVYVGSDLGGNIKPYYINKRGVCGAPDALFFDLFRLRFIVGEYKSRNYSNYVKTREYYQVILYVGLMTPLFFPRAKGFICYGCGEVVPIKYSHKVFKGLMNLKPEIIRSKEIWKSENPVPLKERL